MEPAEVDDAETDEATLGAAEEEEEEEDGTAAVATAAAAALPLVRFEKRLSQPTRSALRSR